MQTETFMVATPHDFRPVVTAVLDKTVASINTAALVLLTGDLGAGKTTFTQQLAAYLGVTEPVVSPTFGIMKRYELEGNEQFDHLVHIDAYRIEDINEVGPLRLKEVFQTPRTLICLEWPERIAAILPAQKIAVSITIVTGEERQVTVT